MGQEADAGAERKALIPIMIDKVRPPLGLARIQAADLVQWTATNGGPLPLVLKSAILRKLPASPVVSAKPQSAAPTAPANRVVPPAPPRPRRTVAELPRVARPPSPPASSSPAPSTIEQPSSGEPVRASGFGEILIVGATVAVIGLGIALTLLTR